MNKKITETKFVLLLTLFIYVLFLFCLKFKLSFLQMFDFVSEKKSLYISFINSTQAAFHISKDHETLFVLSSLREC